MASECQQRRRCDVAGVGAQCDCLHHIGCASDGTADNQRYVSADSFVTKTLVNRCKSKLNRNSDVVADSCRCRAGTAAESVDRDDVGTASCNTARDCRNVMNRRYLYDNGLFVIGCFL